MQRVWRYVVLGAVMSLPMACKKAPTPAEIAAHAAKGYYDQLLSGKYEDFVAGTYMPYKIPDSYRRQLVDNARMFVAQQKQEHRGIKKVKILDAKADTVKHVANVYLIFEYGDSTREEVCVPMVEKKGVWYTR